MKFLSTHRLAAAFAIMSLAFLGFSSSTSAQKYTFSPDKTITVKWGGLEGTHIDIDIDNKTDGELKLSWLPIENNLPFDWSYSLCDNMNCYPGIPMDGRDFAPINKGEFAFFKLQLDPASAFVDNYTVKILVYETGKLQAGADTVAIHIQPLSTGVTEETTPFAAVLPNPAVDIVHLSAFNAVQTVEVFSAVGVKVMEVANSSAEVSLDVRSLPVGVYFVKAYDIYGKTNTATFHKF
ncbi:MAG: T9SS type A sorting domain-containing protein [Candidatus Kapaibacterium sp.]